MARDPKTMITPDAFTVAPELLGYALATPFSRLAAILIDLILAAIISNAGFFLLMLAAAGLTGWRIIGGPIERLASTRGRTFFRVAGAIVAVIVFLNVRGAVMDRVRDRDSDEEPQNVEVNLTAEQEQVTDGLNLSVRQSAEFAVHMAALHTGDERESAAREFGAWVADLERPEDELREAIPALAAVVPEDLHAAYYEGADFDMVAEAAPPSADTVLLSYASALAQNDTVRARELYPAALDALAADSIARLNERVTALNSRNERLDNELDELRDADDERGFVRRAISSIMDDLGIGLGWTALYFTAFVVLGGGQTPGKKLLRIRVIRLDNRPLGWWLAFERFGGYGACVATGLLGFAQILWDRNRQGLHDKATETVVIRLRDGQPVRLEAPFYRPTAS